MSLSFDIDDTLIPSQFCVSSKVCDWLYTLTPGTPVLLANSGIYMFPDTLDKTPGSFVGIVLSSELPAADRETFNDLLAQQADLRFQVWLCRLVLLFV